MGGVPYRETAESMCGVVAVIWDMCRLATVACVKSARWNLSWLATVMGVAAEARQQAGRRAGGQAGGRVGGRAGRQAGGRAGGQAGRQAGRQARFSSLSSAPSPVCDMPGACQAYNVWTAHSM